ncbi:uncharacterized protein FA14DRAFT_157237 [Meira miltonrushii]|uniref:Transcription activator of gluconeogenesis ERT1 n=1 Tax=Meira miltonrushii TaxID=1280837 RepID=A0A316V4Q1_9BASI|nr:uncharacterized protein FA14DRAFT_157237 [Meira miltonrushii]PWN32527.1 hypothetical protein FA14DRAFT_157237 [Meira miltonrushii]
MTDRGGIATMSHSDTRFRTYDEAAYHHHNRSSRPTLPPLLPTSIMEEKREMAPILQSPPASTPFLQLPSPISSTSNPRRLRSASEATAHQPPFRTLFAPPPPPFGSSSQSHASIDSSSTSTTPANPAYARSDRGGSPVLSTLPPLSRFSSNIRRSNTISAVLHHGPSSLGGGNGTLARQLPPPHRIFSRKLSDASSRSQHPSLPAPFAQTGSPSHAQHGAWQQYPHHNQYGQSVGSLKEPLTPGAMSNSSSFSTNTTTSSIASAIAHHSATSTGLGTIAHSPSSSTSTVGKNMGTRGMIDEVGTSGGEEHSPSSRKMAKVHVPSACLNCKKAHLACDVNRPCRRCINLGKTDTCIDVRHKKRGRPRLRDREHSANSTTMFSASNSSSSPRQGIPSTPPHYGQMHHNTSPFAAAASGITRGRSISAASIGSGAGGMSRNIAMAYGTPNQQQYPQQQHQQSSTWMILSTSLHCARNSTNLPNMLGSVRQDDLLGTFLLDIIHPADVGRVENMWNLLIKPVDVPVQPLYAHPDTIMSMSSDDLMTPATGTVYLREENIRIAQVPNPDGRTSYIVRSIGFHLGGGTFGVDLYRKHTFDRAYIVASFW